MLFCLTKYNNEFDTVSGYTFLDISKRIPTTCKVLKGYCRSYRGRRARQTGALREPQ